MGFNRRRKQKAIIFGILKDKASLAKAVAAFSPARSAVIRATPHGAWSPPPEHRVAAVLERGGECADALAARLRGTGSAAVALKCLVLAHSALSHSSGSGSASLGRQLVSSSSAAGGLSFQRLSAFDDRSEISAWVRWYASVVELSLVVSWSVRNHGEVSLSSQLLSELDVLVDYAERASEAPVESSPDSLVEVWRNGLLYEVLRLVGKEYKLVQRVILDRGNELGRKSMSWNDWTRFLGVLKRLEDCKERLVLVFRGKRWDEDFWGSIGGIMVKAVEMIEKKTLLIDSDEKVNYQGNWITFFNNPFFEPGQLVLSTV